MSRFTNGRLPGESDADYTARLDAEIETMVSEIIGRFPWIEGQCECESPVFTPDPQRQCEHCGRFVNFEDEHDAEEWGECIKLPAARGENDDIERFGRK
jgi:hypothetical protein